MFAKKFLPLCLHKVINDNQCKLYVKIDQLVFCHMNSSPLSHVDQIICKIDIVLRNLFLTDSISSSNTLCIITEGKLPDDADILDYSTFVSDEAGLNSKQLLPLFQRLLFCRLVMTEVQSLAYQEDPLFELAELLHDAGCKGKRASLFAKCSCNFHKGMWYANTPETNLNTEWVGKANQLVTKYGNLDDIRRAVQIMKDLKTERLDLY